MLALSEFAAHLSNTGGAILLEHQALRWSECSEMREEWPRL